MDNNNYYNACGSIIARYGIEVDNVSEQLHAVGIGANNFNRIEELYPHLLEYISLDIEGISSGSESIVRPLTPDGMNFLSQEDRSAVNNFINSYNIAIRDLNLLRIQYIASGLTIEARDANNNIVIVPDLNREIVPRNQQLSRHQLRPTI
jgi:hypothetical protein